MQPVLLWKYFHFMHLQSPDEKQNSCVYVTNS